MNHMEQLQESLRNCHEGIDRCIKTSVRLGKHRTHWGIINPLLQLPMFLIDLWKLHYWSAAGSLILAYGTTLFCWWIYTGSIKRTRKSKMKWIDLKVKCENLLKQCKQGEEWKNDESN